MTLQKNIDFEEVNNSFASMKARKRTFWQIRLSARVDFCFKKM